MDISDHIAEKALTNGWGGRREGSGRLPGGRNFTTVMREAMINEIRGRTFEHTNNLYLAQLTLALGYKTLWKIEKELVVGPKGGKKYIAKRPTMVTSNSEVEDYLISLVDGTDNIDLDDGPGATYYYMVTVPPNNAAIESLLERTLGSVKDMKTPDGGGAEAGASQDILQLTQKLNDLHSGASFRSNGTTSNAVDSQTQN